MILPDTSAWIDFLNSRGTALESHLAAGDSPGNEVAYTEPVLMEVLSGARDDREWASLRRLVTGASLLAFDSLADFESAARLRRMARSNGITPGKVDCLIVSVAVRTGAQMLTLDHQQARVAELAGVEVV